MKKKKEEDPARLLDDAFAKWEHLYNHGGSDPFWPDGMNLRFLRNHIIYYKQQIEECCEDGGYPESYYRPLPPETDAGYMARKDEIMANARRSLSEYKANGDYQYILAHRHGFTEKTAEKMHVPSVLGYVARLEEAIGKGDYVTMRRHEDGRRCMDSFRSVAEKMKLAPDEDVQLSLLADAYENAADDAGEENAIQITL
jgi:hypothetical protein